MPVLTKMINISIETANVPVQLMEAMIRPKLKKESLDHEVYSNFRPISNLKIHLQDDIEGRILSTDLLFKGK